jgi:hypothetical protein
LLIQFYSFLSKFSLVFSLLQVVFILLLTRSLVQVFTTFYTSLASPSDFFSLDKYMDTTTLYHCTYDTTIYTFSLVAIRRRVSFFMIFSALSRRCFCTPALYPHLLYSSVPLTYFCGHSLDINKIILSYLIAWFTMRFKDGSIVFFEGGYRCLGASLGTPTSVA